VQEMVHLSGEEAPHPLLSSLYEERYQAFLAECKKRGYILKEQ
jgi:hypothetical protein